MDTEKIKINGQILHPDDIQLKLKTENLPEWEKDIFEFILNWFNNSDFILQQTSGSTGTPKELKLKKTAMIASAHKTIHFFNLKTNDTAWLCLPIAYIAGKMMVVRAIIGQLNLIITEPEGTPQIPNREIDFTAMVPLQVQKLIDANASFKPIQKLIIGGAPTHALLLEKLQHLSTQVYATYGMSETCSHIALQRINGSAPDEYFRLLPGISISTNSENCLTITAPGIVDEPIQTNDVAELLSENMFKIIGRADHVINSGGIKIWPEQLEKAISALIHLECLIVPLDDILLGQKTVLVLESKDKVPEPEELLLKIKNTLGKHRAPRSVYYLNEFPRTASMKIDRKEVLKKIVQP